MTERNLGDSQTFWNLKQHSSKYYKEKITREIWKCFELNRSENKTPQNLKDAANAVLKEKNYSLKCLY